MRFSSGPDGPAIPREQTASQRSSTKEIDLGRDGREFTMRKAFEIGGLVSAAILTVPQNAVLNSGLRQVVFVDRGDGFLEPRDVKTGRRFDNRIEILSGLKAGERIVTSGNFLIDSESQLSAAAGAKK